MIHFNESGVEDAALGMARRPWPAPWSLVPTSLRYAGCRERPLGGVVLGRRPSDALARLNTGLPAAALDDAFRKLT